MSLNQITSALSCLSERSRADFINKFACVGVPTVKISCFLTESENSLLHNRWNVLCVPSTMPSVGFQGDRLSQTFDSEHPHTTLCSSCVKEKGDFEVGVLDCSGTSGTLKGVICATPMSRLIPSRRPARLLKWKLHWLFHVGFSTVFPCVPRQAIELAICKGAANSGFFLAVHLACEVFWVSHLASCSVFQLTRSVWRKACVSPLYTWQIPSAVAQLRNLDVLFQLLLSQLWRFKRKMCIIY